jgi:DNA-binding transcriptional LysR family regulator
MRLFSGENYQFAIDTAPLPFVSDIVSMYLAWHRREHLDPAHQWLRQRIKERVSEIA